MTPVAESTPTAVPPTATATGAAPGAAQAPLEPSKPAGDIESLALRSSAADSLAAGSGGAPRSAAASATTEQVAVFVCHGMGQQVPFETLDTVATTIARYVARSGGGESPIEVGLAPFDGRERPLPRAAITLARGKHAATEVHIFESYWAPITEGNVTLRDVMRFLFGAGCGGVLKARHGFKRWAFGSFQDFGNSYRAPLFLVIALLVVSALLLVNAVIVAVTTARFLNAGPSRWPGAALVADLSVDLVMLAATFGFAIVVFGLAHWRHKRHAEAKIGWNLTKSWLPVWIFATVVAVWGSIVAVLITAYAMGRQLLWHGSGNRGERIASLPSADPVVVVGTSWWSNQADRVGLLGFDWQMQLAHWLALGDAASRQAALIALVWLVAFGVSAWIRSLLVQYVGDVAAYVSAHEASRFCKIRAEIQKEAFDVANTVYNARRADGRPLYDRIVVVGHSLGSVVAYDTLNAVVNLDRFAAQPSGAADRTSMFLTFGSPLDKTAFVFRNQKAIKAPVREAMAAQLQPLLLADEHRPKRWVNVHSWHDWISGPLNYYERAQPRDRPPPPPDFSQDAVRRSRVENIADPAACLHLMAHTQYWMSPFVARLLYEGISGRAVDDPPARNP